MIFHQVNVAKHIDGPCYHLAAETGRWFILIGSNYTCSSMGKKENVFKNKHTSLLYSSIAYNHKKLERNKMFSITNTLAYYNPV